MKNTKVCAIVLNWNDGEATAKCMESILAGTIVPAVIIVDNASTDGSRVLLESRFPGLTILKNKKNLGFSGGMNVGIRFGTSNGADFFWLLNNDTVVEREALEELLGVAREHPECGLFSPVIYTEDGKALWFLGGRISYLRMRATHLLTTSEEKEVSSSEYLTGCALFLSRTLVEKINLLDESYFLYYEDVAYSLSARRAGFSPSVVRKAKVFHGEKSRTNPEKTYWLVRSGIHFFRVESPWYWRPWIETLLLLRKIKNTLDLFLSPTPIAREVKRAYTDAS
ncbi:MAG: glycosyltransferase family 2 protein [Candidatus Moraniibacteriota bacterium]